MIKEQLEKAIQEGLELGTKISTQFTPEIREKIREEANGPKIPTLTEQLGMLDLVMEPDHIKR